MTFQMTEPDRADQKRSGNRGIRKPGRGMEESTTRLSKNHRLTFFLTDPFLFILAAREAKAAQQVRALYFGKTVTSL